VKAREALEVLGTVTAEQWGMVTGQQAKALGVDAVTLHRLQNIGHLERVRRGVYAVTTATVTDAREEQAAWLWLNPTAPAWTRPPLDPDGGVLSHQSAARLHQLGELVNDRITVTTPRRRTSRDPDLRLITRTLAADEVTAVDGLPVTTALRTISDLVEKHTDGSHLATIIRQAVEAGLVQLDALAEHLGPYALRYGVRRAGDGEALLEQLLAEIGTTTAELAHRPAPPRTETALALAQLQPIVLATLAKHNAGVDQMLRGFAALASNQDALIATFASGLVPIVNALARQDEAVRTVMMRNLTPGLLTVMERVENTRTALDRSQALDAAAYVMALLGAGLAELNTAVDVSAAGVGDGAVVDDDDGHAAAAPPHPEELPGLPEGQGPQHGG
jgi:predicted transcriptional regulator of viral defense system